MNNESNQAVNTSQFSRMPEPTGPIAEVAGWLFRDIMVFPQRDLAIIGAWLLVASFAGRKDSYDSNPPVVQIRILGINGVGKDTTNVARKRILQALRETKEFDIETTDEHGNKCTLNKLQFLANTRAAFGSSMLIGEDRRTLSSLRIFNEAGIMGKTRAGDGATVTGTMMQNVSQEAYAEFDYKLVKGADTHEHPVYGPNISTVAESTREAFVDLMSGQETTGEAARTLTFYIDASRIGDGHMRRNAMPDKILKLFTALAHEALRDEELTVELPTKDGEGRYQAPNFYVNEKPVHPNHRRGFTPGDGVVDYFNRLLAEETAYRRSNKGNEASLEWAQRARKIQQIARLAAIHCRTRTIAADPKQWPVLEMQDIEAAEAVEAEARRTELANVTDYSSPISRLVETMRQGIQAEFARPSPSTMYERYHESHDWPMRQVRSSFFTGPKGTPGREADAILKAEPGRYRSKADVLRAAAKEGQDAGYWTFDDPASRGWMLKIEAGSASALIEDAGK